MPDSRAIRALLSLGMVVSLGATGTYAYWTDSVQVAGTTISTGTIDLQVDNQDGIADLAKLDIAAMVPGNSVAGVLAVKNAGTAPLRYHVNASYTNGDGKNLGAALEVRVTDGAVTGSGAAKTCTGTLLASSTGFGANMLASAASPRTLAATSTENICIEAKLPTTALTGLQGATTVVTMNFSATSF